MQQLAEAERRSQIVKSYSDIVIFYCVTKYGIKTMLLNGLLGQDWVLHRRVSFEDPEHAFP